MSKLPDPLVPAHVDLTGYGWMPLHGHRLFGSEFNARCSDAAWRAGVTLWWAAWNQVPAASLPDDDAALCRLADLGRDVKAWKKLREEALHGFVLCSNGRMYHKVLSSLALEAWDRRVKERARKAKWRDGHTRDRDVPVTGTNTGTNTGQRRSSARDGTADRKGQDSREGGEPPRGSPPFPDQEAQNSESVAASGPASSLVAGLKPGLAAEDDLEIPACLDRRTREPRRAGAVMSGLVSALKPAGTEP